MEEPKSLTELFNKSETKVEVKPVAKAKADKRMKSDVPIRELILKTFIGGKELSTQGIIEAVKSKAPKANPNSVQQAISALKSQGAVSEARREGRSPIYRLGGDSKSPSGNKLSNDLEFLLKNAANLMSTARGLEQAAQRIKKRLESLL